jgi:hypothetical protein
MGGRVGCLCNQASTFRLCTVLLYLPWGNNNVDRGWGIAVDSSGATYIAGSTSSANFPTANPIQGSLAAGNDAFVTKIGSGTPPPTHRSDGRRSVPTNVLLLLLE